MVTIPEDYEGDFYTITATDNFSIWKGDENPPGSGSFDDLADVTDRVESGGLDADSVKLLAVPVELTKFEARKDGSNALLTWRTASEINNSHFMIERSEDGERFETIGKVAGAGTSVIERSYVFQDESPSNGINYYRLAQYDFDGAVTRSDIRTVEFGYIGGSGSISIYPNPVVDNVVIETTGVVETISVVVYDTAGKVVIETETEPNKELNLSELSVGVYILKVYDSARYEIGTETITIIKIE